MEAIAAPKLTFKRENGIYRELEWNKDLITVGRDRENDLIIDHPQVSRRHAQFLRDDTGFAIRDLKSTNGTLLNGEIIQGMRELHHQDKVKIADALITFQDPQETLRGPLAAEVLRAIREELRIDSPTKTVFICGKPLDPPLTLKEFQLLDLLYQRKGQVVSKAEIAKLVWDYDVFDFNAIDALVYRLRHRIEPGPNKNRPRYLLTQRGFGYKLVTNPESSEEQKNS